MTFIGFRVRHAGGSAPGGRTCWKLNHIVPALLIVFALYFLFSPRIGDRMRITESAMVGLFGLLIGFSLGFTTDSFGPGHRQFLCCRIYVLLLVTTCAAQLPGPRCSTSPAILRR